MARQLKSMGPLPAFDYTGFISTAKFNGAAVEVDGDPTSV
jgi:hypothetical protein